jgi:hypothetical protein
VESSLVVEVPSVIVLFGTLPFSSSTTKAESANSIRWECLFQWSGS